MNRIILCGRLTADPDISYVQTADGSICKARFCLAVDRKIKKDGENNADFFTCIAWRKVAEIIEKHVGKGVKILIEGSVQTGSYTNREGRKVYTTDVVVESLEFCESKKQEEPQPSPNEEPYMSVPTDIDELPFK